MGNGCPVCGGIGQVLAFGFAGDLVPIGCPECAGLAFTPASADDLRAGVRQRGSVPAQPAAPPVTVMAAQVRPAPATAPPTQAGEPSTSEAAAAESGD